MHNIYIYTHTQIHNCWDDMLWYWYIEKSDILLQLQFLWSLNSNLQINRLGATDKMPRVKSFDTVYSSSSSPKQSWVHGSIA